MNSLEVFYRPLEEYMYLKMEGIGKGCMSHDDIWQISLFKIHYIHYMCAAYMLWTLKTQTSLPYQPRRDSYFEYYQHKSI